MAKEVKEYDRSDMAAIVAKKLGMTKTEVLAVYKATGEEMPAALAQHNRIEIFGWHVATLKKIPGRPYKITTPSGTVVEGESAGYLKLEMKAHRPLKTKIQIATGEKVK